MHSRFFPFIAALISMSALPGCVQATRHSNTMIFGTNTQFGIRAGTTPASVPEVNIGYSRQEAVVLPLVANASDNGTYQAPCDPTQPVQAEGGAKFAVHPCLLVAINGSAQDSYSVLASFGAKFDGQARPDGAGIQGGLAQYFATGMAAQLLALSGGASVVAVGEAAAKAAENEPTQATVAQLFGNEAAYTRGVAMRNSYTDFRTKLLAKIELTDPAKLSDKITQFEKVTTSSGRGIAAQCTSIAACKAAVVDNDAYRDIYGAKQAEFDKALGEWPVP